jgi:general stress protein 26
MTRDNIKANELWNSEAQAWWPDGPTDPDVRVLCVFPEAVGHCSRSKLPAYQVTACKSLKVRTR